MPQNPLLFYGLLEISFIFLLLSGFYYWQLRKLRTQLDEAWRVFGATIEQHRPNLARSANQALADDADGYLNALEDLADEAPPGTAESWQRLWQALMRPWVKPENPAQDGEKLQSAAEQQDMEAMLEQQSRQIAELTYYKNHLVQLLHGKFEHMQHSHQDLLANTRHLAAGQVDMHGLPDIIARIEENGENIQMMAGEFEKAKMWLDPYLEELNNDNRRLMAENRRNHAKIRDLAEQTQLSEAKIRELAKKVEQRTQAYNQLQRRYEDLQRDYLQLLK